jgi:hypothetical protein
LTRSEAFVTLEYSNSLWLVQRVLGDLGLASHQPVDSLTLRAARGRFVLMGYQYNQGPDKYH